MTFKSLGLHPKLLQAVTDLGFSEPTPIQRDAIPPGLEGRDILACAMTGSGKTAAFLLPLLDLLLEESAPGPRVLIVVPTRELAVQVAEDLRALARHTKIRVTTIFGGVGMEPQIKALRAGVDVIVATPGRLLDHLRNQGLRLDRVEALVLDEADRMLDMGFLPDVKRVLAFVPKDRQTLFFSATIPEPVRELSDRMLQNPVRIAVERKSAPAHGITQRVFEVGATEKTKLVLQLLRSGALDSAIIFTRTKHRANRLHAILTKNGLGAAVLHGNRSQSQRQKALGEFKQGKVSVLVATDIAARGIDVENLSHVINFDVPNVPEDYIHRVGRTARAQKTGDAFTLVSPEERGDLVAIERAIGRPLERAALGDSGQIVTAVAGRGGSREAPRAPQLRGRAARARDDAEFGPAEVGMEPKAKSQPASRSAKTRDRTGLSSQPRTKEPGARSAPRRRKTSKKRSGSNGEPVASGRGAEPQRRPDASPGSPSAARRPAARGPSPRRSSQAR